jgi:hypothetical protein
MARILPSRYTPEVNDRIINEAARILAEAASSGKPRQRPTLAIAAVLFAVVVLGGLAALDFGDGQGGGGVAFDRSSVISADATGTGAKARDFLAARAPQVFAPSSPQVSPNPVVASVQRPGPRVARAGSKTAPPIGAAEGETPASSPDEEVLFDSGSNFVAVVPAAEPRAPIVLNVGARIPIVLAEPLTTGATSVPLNARVASDVMVGSRVALAAGSPVIGEGFAVHENDRVQAVLAAVVVDRRTLPLQGLVLGGDGELGLAGKVLKKGAKTKGAAGRILGVLGSAANAASLGLFATKPGLAEAAAVELTQDATRSLDRLGERWSLSNKVVRVPAGTTAYVYLRSDLELP